MLRKIRPEEAEIGMYVADFEGSWYEHPFWRARFVIKSEKDLARVRDGGVDVIVDPEKGTVPTPPPASPKAVDAPVRSLKNEARRQASQSPVRPSAAKPIRRMAAPATFGRADRTRAAIAADNSAKAVAKIFDDCSAGKPISIAGALYIVEDISRSLDINNAAFNNVTRLRSKDTATYMHSVAVSALMIGFARELALPVAEVNLYGVAGLMHDIGKLSIDTAILQKNGPLTPDEMAIIRQHPQTGHALLSSEECVAPVVLDVCLSHHERIDGSGYPFGLAGDAISRAARVAAICDVYDALVSARSYKDGMPGSAAISMMQEMTGHFDADLLFRFMRSAGYYPSGKLLRLRSNRLGVVLPMAREDSAPVVRGFYSTTESCFIDYQDSVLSDKLSDDQAIRQEESVDWFEADWPAMLKQIQAGRYPAINCG